MDAKDIQELGIRATEIRKTLAKRADELEKREDLDPKYAD